MMANDDGDGDVEFADASVPEGHEDNRWTHPVPPLPPEPGAVEDDDCLGLEGDPEELPEGDADDEEGTGL